MRVKMPKINREELAAGPWLVPPLDEQCAIADYLDRETARIDMLIEEQQRLVEMLRDRRQAVIEHATATGGATPPNEWRTMTLRRVGRFVTGTTPSGEPDEVFDPDGRLSWARPEDLGGRVVPSRRLSASGAVQTRPTRDAVLVCCIGATVGKVGWVDGLIASNQQITAIEVDGATKYWYYALTGSRSALVALAVGNTIPILNNVRLAELKVAVPPLEEQRRLVTYLDDQTGKIDTLIAETERFIELSKERRAALITAAVTGQVDVREVA
ncbi:restriction endonuclease subunit S [Streptomyces sp. ISL-86]|uniref:restriction endonuclease subunit S n=1 Tax=Streptomyces sp. ISL-86 TaxID=2819187 RepID=UPI001BEB2020|nr:restriction endonuclease subunit S [Streptomyces sp. ISL-86]MBT2456034.1 restriction endonuclease subunit S [Streptomyces sp. ISL-86]